MMGKLNSGAGAKMCENPGFHREFFLTKKLGWITLHVGAENAHVYYLPAVVSTSMY